MCIRDRLEMAPMDNQRRLSQEQLQHAQQIAARDLVRGLAHEIKMCIRDRGTAHQMPLSQEAVARPRGNLPSGFFLLLLNQLLNACLLYTSTTVDAVKTAFFCCSGIIPAIALFNGDDSLD